MEGAAKLTLDNRVHGATLLAVATVNALGHVDIISCRPATSIHTFLGLDGDCLSRADGFAELAGDAALFTGGVPTEGVFTTETRGNGTLFEGVVDCVSARKTRINSSPFLFILFLISSISPLGAKQIVWYLRWSEKLLQHHVHTPKHLSHQKVFRGLVD